jgi:hypothetical protein
LSSGAGEAIPFVASKGEYAAAAWTDARLVYALVTRGEEALRRLF